QVHATGHFVLHAAHELVGVRGLAAVGEDGARHAGQDEVVRGVERGDALGHGPGQALVEVIGAADAGVGVQGTGGQVVGDLGVEPSAARVDLGLAAAREVVGGADARTPVVGPGELARGRREAAVGSVVGGADDAVGAEAVGDRAHVGLTVEADPVAVGV